MAQDDSCCVICDSAKCDVYFSPCLHRACKDCVQRIRIANVYKADRGVKCPFCRQTIEGYLDAPPPPPPAANSNFPSRSECSNKTLAEENLFGRRGNLSIGRGNDYIPCRAATGGLKMVFKVAEVPPGYVIPQLRPDIDVHAMAFDKRAINLVFMLREEYSKRHKVAKTCRDVLTPFALRLALNGSANYVLQGMLDYAGAFRDDLVNGESFFTALVRSLCRKNGFVKAAHDARGTFSAQKMLLLMQGAEELRLVMKSINGSVAAMSVHHSGAYVIQWLAERTISSLRCFDKRPSFPEDEAVKCLAQLAMEMTANSTDLMSIAAHQVSGPLVEIIRWSLPDNRSMKAALDVVKHAEKITNLENGHRILQGLLSIEVKQVAEQLIQNLQGKYSDMLLDQIAWKLVHACLATRCVDESSRLLIIDELLDSLEMTSEIVDTHHGCKVIVFGFATLSQSSLDDRLLILRSRIYSRKYDSLSDGIESMRWSLLESEGLDDDSSSSDGSVCEISMDVEADDADHDQVESVTSEASSPRTSPTEANRSEYAAAAAAEAPPTLPLLPTIKAGTYAPPHVRQALGLADSSRIQSPGDKLVCKTGTISAVNLGAIGSQRESPPAPAPAPAPARSSCVVCSSRDANIVFLDCSHMCCCSSCAYSASSCPVCSSPVRQVIRVEVVTATTTSSSYNSAATTTATTSSQTLPASATPTVYPSASDLLPSDLFQTISICCDSPPVCTDQPPLVSSKQFSGQQFYSSSSSSSSDQFSGLERFGMPPPTPPPPPSTSFRGTGYFAAQPVTTTRAAAAGPRPYRPPDVFNTGKV